MVVLLFVTIDFLSTVLASMVGVVYFLVRPEIKNYITSGNLVMEGEQGIHSPENSQTRGTKHSRRIRRAWRDLPAKVHHERNRPITVEDAPGRRSIV